MRPTALMYTDGGQTRSTWNTRGGVGPISVCTAVCTALCTDSEVKNPGRDSSASWRADSHQQSVHFWGREGDTRSTSSEGHRP